MKLNKFYKEYSKAKEIKIIGKEFCTKDKLVELIGFYRIGKTVQLVFMEYDEKQIKRENEVFNEFYHNWMPTNREIEYREIKYSGINTNIEKVIIDDVSFDVDQDEIIKTHCNDYEVNIIFSQFFANGWKPKNICKKEMSNCCLCFVKFKDKFSEIPKFNENTNFVLKYLKDTKKILVEKEITLDVTKEYKEKIYFEDSETGETHWVFINKIFMMDLFKDKLTEIEETLNLFPNGKGFMCVEYESDLDLRVEFKSESWLEVEEDDDNCIENFVLNPKNKYGINGNLLQAKVIEQAFDLSCEKVEAEIFCFYKSYKTEDIEI